MARKPRVVDGSSGSSDDEREELLQILRLLPSDVIESILSQEPTKAEKEQQEFERWTGFVTELGNLPLSAQPPENLAKRWGDFRNYNVKLVAATLKEQGVSREKLANFVVFGWAFFDPELGALRYRFGPPLSKPEALPIVLFYHNASWEIPPLLMAGAAAHPEFRRSAGDCLAESPKERVLKLLMWAAELPPNPIGHYRLAEWAGSLLRMLDPETSILCEDSQWVRQVSDIDQFWEVLATAIDFGTHFNARRLFLDGRLLETSKQAIINGKLECLQWWLVIEEAVREEYFRTRRILSPGELREALGGKGRAGSSSEVVAFDDRRFLSFPEIKWGLFQKYAKRAQKIWSDHRSTS